MTTIEGQKRFCSNACKFHVTDGQNVRDQITSDSDRRPNTSDQIAFCVFHSFLVEVQTNGGYIFMVHV